MSHVREIIELLIKIFKENGILPVKSECFRAAKFDKNEVAATLWRLLFELLYVMKFGKIEDYVRDFIDQLKQEDMVVYTKFAMQEHGYLCGDFSNLPTDASTGSRGLLLAIGWLLSTKRLIDKLVDLHPSPLDLEFPIQEPVSIEQQPMCSTNLHVVQKAQQLQLQTGRLSLSLKTLYSLYREETRLQHKIHENTAGVSTFSNIPHLSAMEVYILRHPEQLKRCMKQLEQDNERLHSLIQWKEHEHIFWKWMESVLHLKQAESSQKLEDCPHMVHYNISPGLLGSITKSRRKLESAIMKFEPVITQLEEIWYTKEHDVSKEEVIKIEAAVNSDISLHQQNSSQDKKFRNTSLYRNSRFIHIKPTKQKVSNVKIAALNNNPDCSTEPVEIQSEISSFLEDINRLEIEIQRKERFYRKQLDTLASNLKDAVCIQPSSLSK